nr:retrovirus-related Pol polyprotein from transposon TNT 1-94 [Tanacetum cinerariifolium]
SILADSKLPTMFWTEAVSTACYVLNRVSVTNPYNKTPYELLSGKVILVPSFPSNSFLGPPVQDVSTPMKNNFDYAEELARLQRQEYEAHSAATKHGFEFFVDTAALLPQADIEIRRNLVPAVGDPAGSIVPTGGVPAGSDPAGSIVPTGGVLAGSSVPASDVPTGSILVSSVPAGGVLLVVSFLLRLILGDLQSPVQTRSTVQKSQFEPSSVEKALVDPDWVAAMQEEMQQFYHQQVWKLVPLLARKITIGHRQEEGIDYDEVFASVARIDAIRLFLAFASYMGFMVYQMDVKSAFFYGEIEEEVYVTQPKGLEDPYNPKHVYRVVKALYGLHQAPRAWYARLSTFLLKHHYRWGTIDKTLFLKKDSRHIILVQVYMDDFIFGFINKAWCDEFEVLMKGEFEMSAMGELMFFLWLQVKQLPDGIFISQDKYVKEMLKKFDMESVRTVTTPYEVPKHKSKDEPDDAVNVHLFRSMIGSLMYLTAFRPDIMFAVSACSRHQVTPLTSHLNAVKKIFKYLKRQPNLGSLDPKSNVRLWVQLYEHEDLY